LATAALVLRPLLAPRRLRLLQLAPHSNVRHLLLRALLLRGIRPLTSNALCFFVVVCSGVFRPGSGAAIADRFDRLARQGSSAAGGSGSAGAGAGAGAKTGSSTSAGVGGAGRTIAAAGEGDNAPLLSVGIHSRSACAGCCVAAIGGAHLVRVCALHSDVEMQDLGSSGGATSSGTAGEQQSAAAMSALLSSG
jgi:hypothetical protein